MIIIGLKTYHQNEFCLDLEFKMAIYLITLLIILKMNNLVKPSNKEFDIFTSGLSTQTTPQFYVDRHFLPGVNRN